MNFFGDCRGSKRDSNEPVASDPGKVPHVSNAKTHSDMYLQYLIKYSSRHCTSLIATVKANPQGPQGAQPNHMFYSSCSCIVPHKDPTLPHILQLHSSALSASFFLSQLQLYQNSGTLQQILSYFALERNSFEKLRSIFTLRPQNVTSHYITVRHTAHVSVCACYSKAEQWGPNQLECQNNSGGAQNNIALTL